MEEANAKSNVLDTSMQHGWRRKPSRRPSGHSSQESLRNRRMKEKQMTVARQLETGAPSACRNGKAIDWQTVKKQVKRLQMRIAKAVSEGRYHKAKALQWLLTQSYYAKLLAIRRVTNAKRLAKVRKLGLLGRLDADGLRMARAV